MANNSILHEEELDALQVRLTERDKTKHGFYGCVLFNRDGPEAAAAITVLRARVAALEAERDRWRDQARNAEVNLATMEDRAMAAESRNAEWADRADAAEAELQRSSEAIPALEGTGANVSLVKDMHAALAAYEARRKG